LFLLTYVISFRDAIILIFNDLIGVDLALGKALAFWRSPLGSKVLMFIILSMAPLGRIANQRNAAAGAVKHRSP
jgi:hypothetical protein